MTIATAREPKEMEYPIVYMTQRRSKNSCCTGKDLIRKAGSKKLVDVHKLKNYDFTCLEIGNVFPHSYNTIGYSPGLPFIS